MSDILCITNRKLRGEDFFLRIEKIAEAKPEGIILREKDLTESEYIKIAKKAIEICERYGTDCILHTFINTAKELGHKKIHLPLGIFINMTKEERDFFEVIGVSCHSEADAKKAEKLGASYITAGHIFETDCKKGLSGRGLCFLENICKSVSIPVYAIGGISPDNISRIRESGANGACIMSSIMNCGNPKEYLLQFKEKQMNFNKNSLLLYAVTDNRDRGDILYKKVEAALKGGATLIQLREKGASEEELISDAVKIKELCHIYGVPLIINDNASVAIKSGADGVHVGIEDESVFEIRKKAGKNFIIGATAKTVEQAVTAEKEGADYLGVGAVFPSPTKQNAIRITKEKLNEICSSVSIPTVAIGGINYDNITELKGGKMDGFAVVSAVFGCNDIETGTKKLKEKLTGILNS